MRRIHYRIISGKERAKRSDGMPYENTQECWHYLAEASKGARYLRLVDPAAFVDRRNPDPIINAKSREEPAVPVCEFGEWQWTLPHISIELNAGWTYPNHWSSATITNWRINAIT